MTPLLSLVISLVPQIAQSLSGPDAASVIRTISMLVSKATGCEDPAQQCSIIQQNSGVSEALQCQLAVLAEVLNENSGKDMSEEVLAQVSAAITANQQSFLVSRRETVVALGAAVVSAMVIVLFGLVMMIVLTHMMPSGSETSSNVLLGSLATMATSVVSYWVGSSASSARKDETIARASIHRAGSP